MKCSDIISKLEELSPPSFAASWDNPGLLVGRRDKNVSKVYIALDATDAAIAKAIEYDCDMLITHHPMIFRPIKSVCEDDFIGRRILRLARHDISYFAMHTNFDVMGMADAAADELKLRNRDVLDVTYEDDLSQEGFGRVGNLPSQMTLAECAEYVKRVFDLDKVKVFGDLDANVTRAAICPGGGGSVLDAAISSGADVFITGDISYNPGIDAVAKGLYIIDAGHFGTEKLFMPYIKDYISRELPTLGIATHENAKPCHYI